MFKKYSLALVFILAVALSACTYKYPGQKSAVTPSPTTGFAATLPANGMNLVEDLATGTALALTSAATTNPNAILTPSPVGGTPLTPIAQQTTDTPNPNVQVTFTSTPPVVDAVTATPIVAVTTTVGTPVPTGPRPASYTLHQGEFVWCLARRFNVDPNDILALNGLVDSETIYPGTTLTIPQSGSYPGNRALRAHPAAYTVTSADETLYSIACLFGDVSPDAIANRNGITLATPLSVGQVLNIP